MSDDVQPSHLQLVPAQPPKDSFDRIMEQFALQREILIQTHSEWQAFMKSAIAELGGRMDVLEQDLTEKKARARRNSFRVLSG